MVLQQYRAVSDYARQDKKELSFKEGEIFEVVEKNDNGEAAAQAAPCSSACARTCVCDHTLTHPYYLLLRVQGGGLYQAMPTGRGGCRQHTWSRSTVKQQGG